MHRTHQVIMTCLLMRALHVRQPVPWQSGTAVVTSRCLHGQQKRGMRVIATRLCVRPARLRLLQLLAMAAVVRCRLRVRSLCSRSLLKSSGWSFYLQEECSGQASKLLCQVAFARLTGAWTALPVTAPSPMKLWGRSWDEAGKLRLAPLPSTPGKENRFGTLPSGGSNVQLLACKHPWAALALCQPAPPVADAPVQGGFTGVMPQPGQPEQVGWPTCLHHLLSLPCSSGHHVYAG